MIITLDGRPLPAASPPAATLQGLIHGVRETHAGGRLIVSVRVNGQELLGPELGQALAGPISQADRVDLVSAERQDIVADALRELAAQMSQAAAVSTQVGELLAAGRGPAAIERFGDFLRFWQTCRQAIAECGQVLGRDVTPERIGGRTIDEHLRELAGRLRELRDALEARDLVLLGDLVRYELPPLCDGWHGLLTDLAEAIDASHRGA